MVNRVKYKLLRRIFFNSDMHLSDKRLAALLCRELSLVESWVARRHLTGCRKCRLRKWSLEGPCAEEMIQLYRASLDCAEMVLQEEPKILFVQRLKLQTQREIMRQKRRESDLSAWMHRFSSILPSAPITVASALVIGALAFSFLWRERMPDLSANVLLVRAERSDMSSAATNPGVAHQIIQIRMAKQTLKRSVYWDVQGMHRTKAVALSAAEEQLRATLGEAGIDWNQPISASAYQVWHDRQFELSDRISRSRNGLLTLTTSVAGGKVSEETLTVRDTDFHPVQRTVVFRDSETIEIAEVDFKILPWNSVDAGIFEPIGGIGTTGISGASRLPVFPAMPERFTDDQLDETELSARLVLNNLHADTGEQIEIVRTGKGIEVKGLVETNERKRVLQTQLATVPHLTVSVQSVVDLRDHQERGSDVSSVKTESMLDLQSPLETYLLAHGRSVREINFLEQRLYDDALTIIQESRAIDDLKTRFFPNMQTTVLTSAKLSELIYSHHERLQAALKQQRKLLGEVQTVSRRESGVPARNLPPLTDAAIRNLTLCKELTLANSSNPRSAEKILAEIAVLLDDLTADVHEAYGKPQGEITVGRKK